MMYIIWHLLSKKIMRLTLKLHWEYSLQPHLEQCNTLLIFMLNISRWWLRLPWGQDQRTVEEDDLIYRLLYFVRNHTWFLELFQQLSSRMECERSHSFRSVKSYRVKSLHHGKGKDPHQHCRHWPRRLWQVHHHRSLDLQGIIGCICWAGMQPSWWQNSAYYMITFD